MNGATFWFLLLISSCLLYLLYYHRKKLGFTREGMTSGGSSAMTAGQAEQYAKSIQEKVTQMKTSLAISSYRTDYENLIINMDDYLKALLLESVMSFQLNNPTNESANIGQYYKNMVAMEYLMQFVDRN